MTGKKKLLIILLAVTASVVLAAGIYIGDYYHADKAAIACIAEPEDGIVIEEPECGGYTFIPEEPVAGLVFYPGGKVEAESYAPLMEALAERGILAVLVDMPGNLAVLDMDAADGIPELYPEVEKWYIGGHSLGGAMAAGYVSETSGYEGLILLAAYSTEDLSGTGVRVLSIYGDRDKVLDAEKYSVNKSNLPAGFEEVVIKGGCHAFFGAYGAQAGDGEPYISNEEQIEITAGAIEKFIK